MSLQPSSLFDKADQKKWVETQVGCFISRLERVQRHFISSKGGGGGGVRRYIAPRHF